MDKAELFKKWMRERQGHSPQLRLALEAIIELESQVDFEVEQKAIARAQRDLIIKKYKRIKYSQ